MESSATSVATPRAGLSLPPRLPFDKWVVIGRQLSTVHTSSAWCLGDWLVYGEIAYAGRYRKAVEFCSLHYQTLRNYAWVARRFSLSRRRDTLSFGHHAEVARLPDPEQDYWLRKAEELGWSRNRLRSEVRSSLNERDTNATPEQAAGGVRLSRTDDGEPTDRTAEEPPLLLELTPDQCELWSSAAAKAGLTVTAWAVHALNLAAGGIEIMQP